MKRFFCVFLVIFALLFAISLPVLATEESRPIRVTVDMPIAVRYERSAEVEIPMFIGNVADDAASGSFTVKASDPHISFSLAGATGEGTLTYIYTNFNSENFSFSHDDAYTGYSETLTVCYTGAENATGVIEICLVCPEAHINVGAYEKIYFAVNEEYIAFSTESTARAERALLVDPMLIYTIGMVVGGLGIGALCGALPLVYGYAKKKKAIGLAAMAVCMVVGLCMTVILEKPAFLAVIPAAIFGLWIFFASKEKQQ